MARILGKLDDIRTTIDDNDKKQNTKNAREHETHSVDTTSTITELGNHSTAITSRDDTEGEGEKKIKTLCSRNS